MGTTEATRLTRRQIRKAILAKRGAMSDLARSLGIDLTLVTLTLKGNHGGRVGKEREAIIMQAAEKRALELQSQEVRWP